MVRKDSPEVSVKKLRNVRDRLVRSAARVSYNTAV
jgi:uncharacterized protein with HEPN domain